MPIAKAAKRIEDVAFKTWFESKFEVAHEGCWLWYGACDKSGYGQVHYKRKLHGSASRFSYLLYTGDIPNDGLLVCHTCDVRSCVNPAHLWLGTIDDNNRDMRQKGRDVSSPGESNPSHKLMEKDVLQIRELYATGQYKYEELGQRFGVQKMAICDIVLRRKWKHI